MKYVNMKITGITLDNSTFFPLLTLKNDENGLAFPVLLKREEQHIILNALVKKNTIYSGLVKQLIWQQDAKIERVTIEETESDEDDDLISVVYIRRKDKTDKIFLYPAEGIILAIEFGLEIDIPEHMITNKEYFRRYIDDEELIGLELEEIVEDQVISHFDIDSGHKRKKQTIQ